MAKIPLRQTVLEQAGRQGLALDDAQLGVLDLLAAAVRPGGRGVYVWGPPGRGKTWLASAVLDAAEAAGRRVRRVHFHAFFRELHARIFAARSRDSSTAGSAFTDALAGLLDAVDVLCFDEFHVGDPGDGMLVRRMLEAVRLRGITLVATSNYPPEDLLPDPLFHHLMEPAIRDLRALLDVVTLDGGRDYRSRGIPDARREGFAAGWHLPRPGPRTLAAAGLQVPAAGEERMLRPGSKALLARRADGGQLWFGFGDLCLVPSSANDYLKLAVDHRHWVLSEVPDADAEQAEGWARFGNLVDVLYDAGVRLDILGLDGLGDQAPGSAHPTDRARIRSRLGALRRPLHDAAESPGRHPAGAVTRPGEQFRT